MIKMSISNLLTNEKVDVVLHQTNHEGVMNAGIAKDIRDNLLTKEEYYNYKNLCNEFKDLLTGKNQLMEAKAESGKKYVVNMFSQNALADKSGSRTNLIALKMCLQDVESSFTFDGLTIGLPGFIGCGIAGGNWKEVYAVIESVFGNSEKDIWICFLDDESFKKSERILNGDDPDDSLEENPESSETEKKADVLKLRHKTVCTVTETENGCNLKLADKVVRVDKNDLDKK